jgi:hypothetical protein
MRTGLAAEFLETLTINASFFLAEVLGCLYEPQSQKRIRAGLALLLQELLEEAATPAVP